MLSTGVGETLSLDHFSDRDETRLSSRSRLRYLQSLSLGLESRKYSLLGLSLSLEVETSLMCYPMGTFLFPMHTSSCLDLAPSKVLDIKNQYKTLCLGPKRCKRQNSQLNLHFNLNICGTRFRNEPMCKSQSQSRSRPEMISLGLSLDF